jgi:F0F1-type ATP synthase assembly protein I
MAEELPPHGDSRSRPASPPRQGSGAETGWAVTGTLISGMAVWGGAGWLLDRWLGILFFAPAGILLGTAVAIYLVVARYGAVDPPAGQRSGRKPGGRPNAHGGPPRTQKGQR